MNEKHRQMTEAINKAKNRCFQRIHKIEERELTPDLWDYFFILVFRADYACMDWLTWGLGSLGIAGAGSGEKNR